MIEAYDDPSDQRSYSLNDTNSNDESPEEETRLSPETSKDAVPYIGIPVQQMMRLMELEKSV